MQTKTLGVKREILIIVTLLHLFVDFLCVAAVVHACSFVSNKSQKEWIILVYNFVAFLTQPLFGHFIDKIKDKTLYRPTMLLSGAFLIFGLLVSFFTIKNVSFLILGSILLGLGNSCFHVLGGKEVLTQSKKSTPGGIFVSSGALGVGLGIISATIYSAQIFMFIPPIAIFILCLLYSKKRKNIDQEEINNQMEQEQQISTPFESKSLKVVISCLVIICLAIAMRSFLGSYANHDSTIDEYAGLVFLLSVSAFLGKAIGGIIEDGLGPYVLIAISGVLGVVSAFQQNIIILDYIFIFSTNLLMPFTLNFITKFFPKQEGFAFGLAAAFLVPGYYLAQYFKTHKTISMYVSTILVVITIGMVIACCYMLNNKKECSEK